jgi:hypothetical protein
VLGDKAYSSRAIRAHLRRRRITATIPEPIDQANNQIRSIIWATGLRPDFGFLSGLGDLPVFAAGVGSVTTVASSPRAPAST